MKSTRRLAVLVALLLAFSLPVVPSGSDNPSAAFYAALRRVPAGPHRVEMRYRPPLFSAGCAASLAAFALCVVMLVGAPRSRRRRF